MSPTRSCCLWELSVSVSVERWAVITSNAQAGIKTGAGGEQYCCCRRCSALVALALSPSLAAWQRVGGGVEGWWCTGAKLIWSSTSGPRWSVWFGPVFRKGHQWNVRSFSLCCHVSVSLMGKQTISSLCVHELTSVLQWEMKSHLMYNNIMNYETVLFKDKMCVWVVYLECFRMVSVCFAFHCVPIRTFILQSIFFGLILFIGTKSHKRKNACCRNAYRTYGKIIRCLAHKCNDSLLWWKTTLLLWQAIFTYMHRPVIRWWKALYRCDL